MCYICSFVDSPFKDNCLRDNRNTNSFLSQSSYFWISRSSNFCNRNRRVNTLLLICPGCHLNRTKIFLRRFLEVGLLCKLRLASLKRRRCWRKVKQALVHISKRSCTLRRKRSCTRRSCSHLLNSIKFGFWAVFIRDSINAGHCRFLSNGCLLIAISRLLEENKLFACPNWCKLFTKVDNVSPN